ncbi:MAG: 50S ribosomal protein L31 [Chloroflexi bacterium]|nr:50S ribosomal protein L31 [Chloroflexota bacterium]MXW28523.1 50S ribosomal protein L31 [Chloroflexota bacterium]MYC48651.1 50S ribosomal protein L31 [Chloroflexota bacterium]
MKTDVHPQLYDTRVSCTCGNSFTTRATVEKLQLDICSNCHPFFTGTQKLVDTQGQVERFQQRLKKAGRRTPEPTPATPEDADSIVGAVSETDV